MAGAAARCSGRRWSLSGPEPTRLLPAPTAGGRPRRRCSRCNLYEVANLWLARRRLPPSARRPDRGPPTDRSGIDQFYNANRRHSLRCGYVRNVVAAMWLGAL